MSFSLQPNDSTCCIALLANSDALHRPEGDHHTVHTLGVNRQRHALTTQLPLPLFAASDVAASDHPSDVWANGGPFQTLQTTPLDWAASVGF